MTLLVLFISGTSSQFARPVADVADGSWTNESGSATDLFASVDELSSNDADYIQSSDTPVSPDVVKLELGALVDPASSTGHIFRYRYRRGDPGIRARVTWVEFEVPEAAALERDLDGTQPTATGALSRILQALRALAGSQPNATGALTRKLQALRSLTGDQPSATGTLARLIAVTRSLDGSQPAATGTLARLLQASRSLTGSQPTATGTLAAELIVPPQLARPDADTDPGGWTTDSGGTTNLFATLDETSPNDADYIRSTNSPAVADIAKISLSSLDTPSVGTGHILRYRYAKSEAGGDQIDLVVRLKQGATEIASWTHTDISATLTTAEQPLDEAEGDAITDYSNLDVWLEAVKV